MLSTKRFTGVAVVAGALALAMAGTAQAATLTAGTATQVSLNHSHWDISVFDGKAEYKPAGATTPVMLGDGTLLDYRFVTSTTSAVNTYAQGTGNRIGPISSGALAASAAEDKWANVWTSNDPGTNFSTTPNFAAGVDNTHARMRDVSGAIDITGLTDGILYFGYGVFLASNEITVTMTGAGQPDLTASVQLLEGAIGTNNRGWLTDFSFTNDDLAYDTISYDWDLFGAQASTTRGRFMGVALDGTAANVIPESSTLALLAMGLLGLALVAWRRRK